MRPSFEFQQFDARFSNASVEDVNTRIGFDGGGIRVGLEGERRANEYGLMVYGRGAASLMAGSFRAKYTQAHNSVLVVDTDWKSDRVVPILDLEVGVGWVSPGEYFRATLGYMFSAWYNSLSTDDYIRAVQFSDYGGLADTLTFDGVVGRLELRY